MQGVLLAGHKGLGRVVTSWEEKVAGYQAGDSALWTLIFLLDV